MDYKSFSRYKDTTVTGKLSLKGSLFNHASCDVNGDVTVYDGASQSNKSERKLIGRIMLSQTVLQTSEGKQRGTKRFPSPHTNRIIVFKDY